MPYPIARLVRPNADRSHVAERHATHGGRA